MGPPPGWSFAKGPANGATATSGSVTLNWGAVELVTYDVCYDTTNNSQCDTVWIPVSDTTYTATNLVAGTYSCPSTALRAA